MEKLDNYFNNIVMTNLIPGLLITLSIASIILLIGVVIITVNNSKKKKQWIKDISTGSTCKVHVLDGTTLLDNCEIVQISDDKVVVQFEVSKRFINPPKPKK